MITPESHCGDTSRDPREIQREPLESMRPFCTLVLAAQARSDFLDLRGLGKEGVKEWVDAIATLFELCSLGAFDRPKYGFTYIEHDGSAPSKVPARIGLRVLKGALDVGLKGFPERGNSFTIMNSTRLIRLLFSMARPLMPAALRDKIRFLPGGAAAKECASEILGNPDHVPDFLGGPAIHTLPRTPTGDVDLVELLDAMCKKDSGPGR